MKKLEIKDEPIFVEGIKNAVEGEIVFRRSDGAKMQITGVRCAYLDKNGWRKEEIYSYIELGK